MAEAGSANATKPPPAPICNDRLYGHAGVLALFH
jgi:hypothetical protein